MRRTVCTLCKQVSIFLHSLSKVWFAKYFPSPTSVGQPASCEALAVVLLFSLSSGLPEQLDLFGVSVS